MYKADDLRYEKMQFNRTGKSGLLLPKISLGMWHNFGSVDCYENMRKMAQTAFDNGITHFDLANNYGPTPGSAEENFKAILKDDLGVYRDELIVSSKAGYGMWAGPYGEWGSRKSVLASLDQSLKRTGLEYFDIFYSHRFDPETPLEETMGALATAVQMGKALYAGVSNYDGENTKKAAKILKSLNCPFIINQSSYNIFNRNIENNGLMDAAAQEGIGIIAFSPLAQGLLTDKYLGGIPQDSRIKKSGVFLKESALTPEKLSQIEQLNSLAKMRGESLAEMALAWVLAKGCTSVLIGASNPNQIIQNCKIVNSAAFTQEELKMIDKISLVK